MSQHRNLEAAFPRAAADAPAESDPTSDTSSVHLQSYVSLVQQIQDAILVVENPKLAAELFAALKSKAA